MRKYCLLTLIEVDIIFNWKVSISVANGKHIIIIYVKLLIGYVKTIN